MTSSETSDCPTGVIELHLSVEVPVELIILHWTRDEVATLLAGDEPARDELISQAIGRSHLWSDVDVIEDDVEIEGKQI